jgi:uncharacterized protein YqjF (DUF2071 family)
VTGIFEKTVAMETTHLIDSPRQKLLPKPFLTAEWRNLAVLNYQVDPDVLTPYLPRGTELDLWQGQALVSLVGFEFLQTRVWGFGIPRHRDFAEVNLRFYVRRVAEEGWRRGVVFVRELVARHAVAWIARLFYGENYAAVPMRHRVSAHRTGTPERHEAIYAWRYAGQTGSVAIRARGEGEPAAEFSLEEFIIEHYWGYSGGPRRPTMEYRVEHPRWRLWPAACGRFRGNARALYGASFAAPLAERPTSAFFADGSAVAVYPGVRIA